MVLEARPACREYSLPREDPGSEHIAWIGGHTKIGPVLQVTNASRFDIYGIEIQVPSTSGDGSTSWIIMSRGSNRYVEELQYNVPACCPEGHELANHTSVWKPHARCYQAPRKLVHNSRKRNRTWWATIPKILFQLTKGSGMIFLLMMISKGRLWRISKMVTNLVRHFNLANRETDGAVHRKSMCPQIPRAFEKEDGHTFSYS